MSCLVPVDIGVVGSVAVIRMVVPSYRLALTLVLLLVQSSVLAELEISRFTATLAIP